ncbi:hypothetical protein ACH4ZU_36945 [Streptomyces sp. NPDC020472]|uniref:hypothetical protein n=1 Tax=Streptomyces sp. NPDC020472 TaxID=3365075 RepID=UPI0037B0367A
MDEYRSLTELPLAVSLKAFHHIHVRGTDEQEIRDLVRSMIGQAVALHAPDDLRLMIYGAPQQSGEWEWIDYLPHARRPADHPGLPRTAIADDEDSFTRLVATVSNRPAFGRDEPQRLPYVLIVCDTLPLPDEVDWLTTTGRQGVTLVRLVPDPRAGADTGLEMSVTNGELTLRAPRGDTYRGRADALTVAQATRLARDLSLFSHQVSETNAWDT